MGVSRGAVSPGSRKVLGRAGVGRGSRPRATPTLLKAVEECGVTQPPPPGSRPGCLSHRLTAARVHHLASCSHMPPLLVSHWLSCAGAGGLGSQPGSGKALGVCWRARQQHRPQRHGLHCRPGWGPEGWSRLKARLPPCILSSLRVALRRQVLRRAVQGPRSATGEEGNPEITWT